MKMEEICRRSNPYKAHTTTLLVGVMVLVVLILCVNLGSAFNWTNTWSYFKFDNDFTDEQNHLSDDSPTGAFTASGKFNQGYEIEEAEYFKYNQSISTIANWTINFWFKPLDNWDSTVGRQDIWYDNGGGGKLWYDYLDGQLSCYIAAPNYANYTTTFTSGSWYSLGCSSDNGTLKLYINGDNVANASGAAGSTLGVVNQFGHSGAKNFTIDEFGFWNRTLNFSEVAELYNLGAGLEYGVTSGAPTPTMTNLISPTDGSSSSISEINFTANYTADAIYNLTNATYYVWNSTGIFNDTYVIKINGTYNQTTQQINDFISGDYEWNVKACYANATFSNCSWAASNYSLTWVALTVIATKYNTSALETSNQQFRINVSTSTGYDLQNARLVYNGTEYSSVTKTALGGGNYTLSKSISIPAGTSGFSVENRTFFWNVSLVNEATGLSNYQVSGNYNQTVNELLFGLCSVTLNVSLLNFTLYDEGNGSQINGASNATTFQGTFDIGATSGNLLKTYSINNLSTALTEFDFCTANYTSAIYADLNLFYTAVDYVEKNYFLNNATLTNVTNEINLYLLEETEALEFFIDVEQDLDPLINATINIDKYFVGEGVYKTVEIDETDTDGEFTAYLDLDKQYKFTISKDGEVLGTISKRATCDAAPCEITLSLTTSSDNPFDIFDTAFASNVIYNLSFNSATKIITFDFIDTTGLATYFRMIVYQSYTNQTAISIYDNTLYTSSGGMTFNLTGYSGDFKAEIYISRSPESFLDFITIAISSIAGVLGTLGMFSALLFILTIIFGLSFKPSILVMSVPFALTTAKLAGFVSLSATSIAVLFVLAIIATLVMSK